MRPSGAAGWLQHVCLPHPVYHSLYVIKGLTTVKVGAMMQSTATTMPVIEHIVDIVTCHTVYYASSILAGC